MKIAPVGGGPSPHAFQKTHQSSGKNELTPDQVSAAGKRVSESPVRGAPQEVTAAAGEKDSPANRPVQDTEAAGREDLAARALREISLAGDLSRKGIQFRPFRSEDLPQLLQIAAANFKQRFGNSLSLSGKSLERFLEDFGFVPTGDEPGVIVAEDKGRILGFLRLRRPSDRSPAPPLGWGQRVVRHGAGLTLKGTLIRLLTEKGLGRDECLIESLEIRPETQGRGILAGLLGKARELAADVQGCRYLALSFPEKDLTGQAVGQALQFQHDYTHASLVGMAFLGLPPWTFFRLPLAEGAEAGAPREGLLKTWRRRRKKLWWLGFLGFLALFKFPHMIGAMTGRHSPRVLVHLLWLCYFRYFLPRRP